jgi:TatD DNase family protein
MIRSYPVYVNANGDGAGVNPMPWIDTHCHLDAPEFDADRDAVWQRARAAGVTIGVLPAVQAAHFERVRELAHRHGLAYALGIHPLCVGGAVDGDLDVLRDALARHHDDKRLVAVGEIGLDWFVPGLDRDKQERFYIAQLKLARDAGLPVILHVRRSADGLLAGLRRIDTAGGIAHAFNGSAQQAQAFVERGWRLGFGGAMTFERARQIRELAATLPETAPVLETDAPDIPPQWLYRNAEQRARGEFARNEPAELPRIAQTLAQLRGWSLEQTATRTAANASAALPRLQALLRPPD